VKVLDFGLARPLAFDVLDTDPRLTLPGTAVGTPRAMAPEQWTGEEVGPPADIFAVGALLFEMVTGRAAFPGTNLLEVYHAIVHEQPPALAGGPEAMAIDRVIQRALAKRPTDRFPTAAAMAQALGEASQQLTGAAGTHVRALTRVIVLPFRLLRPDSEIDFLSAGLADAVSASLSSFDTLLVRSSATASRYAHESPDLRKLASEAGVDAVVMGTLMRAGDQVRVTSQLVEAPSGAVICSRIAQGTMRDLFQLQDSLAAEVVEALALPLTTRDARGPRARTPATPAAYEYFLRGNQLGMQRRMLAQARDLYRRCLQEDPRYAPAWARLGRVYRVMAKYDQDGDPEENFRLAEEAFQNALRLDPELPTAHNLYTYLELEELGRSQEAMVRLIERAQRSTADPELFAALVVSCRFCGLLEASLAADRRARQLDPGIRTSVTYTHWAMGDYENAIFYDDDDIHYVRHYSLMSLGRTDEAIAALQGLEESRPPGLEYHLAVASRASLQGRRDECLAAIQLVLDSRFHDPEGLFFLAEAAARVGDGDVVLELLERVVRSGFLCAETMERDPCFTPWREHPRFVSILGLAWEGHRAAVNAYMAARGPSVLGWARA
jgi:TolB-like protein/Flp pilus assembly protein TadD